MKFSALAVLVALVAALLVAGCGGGSSSTGPGGSMHGGGMMGGQAPGGVGKKATAPNAPAGSKVVACTAGHGGMVQLRATAVGCAMARRTMMRWGRGIGCALAEGASRGSCTAAGFRCQAVRVDRGAAVSCARPGGDVSFIAKARMLRKTGPG